MDTIVENLRGNDAYMFFPENVENPNKVKIDAFSYNSVSEPIGGTSMGHLYDIIIISTDDKLEVTKYERFEAILVEPVEYIQNLIKDGFHGVVAKRTQNSLDTFFNKILDVVQKALA
jgi:hypothetical protein